MNVVLPLVRQQIIDIARYMFLNFGLLQCLELGMSCNFWTLVSTCINNDIFPYLFFFKKKLQESQVSKTRLARGEDNELQAGDVDAGSNQQKGHDLWESEWVLV